MAYAYGDGNWKDKLTAYDGKGITYNAIGNPLSYDGWSYTWEGRRLMGMSRSGGGNSGSYGSLSLNAGAMTLSPTQGTQDAGDTFSVDQTGNLTVSTDKAPGSYFLAEGVLKAEEAGGSAQAVSYQYNAKGLRVSKTVDGVTTQYTLHGKLITHLKKGTDELHFFYDAQGKPAMVDFNGTYYAYVYTLQGDIAAIVDNTGTKVVEYGYDGWGKPTKAWSLTHPSESTLTSAYGKLAQLNPFRYRGYVWDEETGLYSLGSRYYDPVWGRFLNSDTYLGKRSGLGSHNVYCYCTNDPVRMFDPNGHEYKISLADLKFDWVGIHILMWYLWGGGEKQTVINSLIWSPYMKNSKLCSTCKTHINDKGLTLSQYTINLLKPYGHELRNGESTTVNLVESVAIQNGEGIIGTNYFGSTPVLVDRSI